MNIMNEMKTRGSCDLLSRTMKHEDWTLLSDSFCEMIKHINAITAYDVRKLNQLKYERIKAFESLFDSIYEFYNRSKDSVKE